MTSSLGPGGRRRRPGRVLQSLGETLAPPSCPATGMLAGKRAPTERGSASQPPAAQAGPGTDDRNTTSDTAGDARKSLHVDIGVPERRVLYPVTPQDVEASPVVAILAQEPGNRLVFGLRAGIAGLLDFGGGLRPYKYIDIEARRYGLCGLALSPDHRQMLAYTGSPTPTLYSREGKVLGSLRQGYQYVRQTEQQKGHTDAVTSGCFLKGYGGGGTVSTSSLDSTIRLFQTERGGYDIASSFCFTHRRRDMRRTSLSTLEYDGQYSLLYSTDVSNCMFAIDPRCCGSSTGVTGASSIITSSVVPYSFTVESPVLEGCNSLIVLGRKPYDVITKNSSGVISLWDKRNVKEPVVVSSPSCSFKGVIDEVALNLRQSMFLSPDKNILCVCHGEMKMRVKMDRKYNVVHELLSKGETDEYVKRRADDNTIFQEPENVIKASDYRQITSSVGYVSFLDSTGLTLVKRVECESGDIPIVGTWEKSSNQIHLGTFKGQIFTLYNEMNLSGGPDSRGKDEIESNVKVGNIEDEAVSYLAIGKSDKFKYNIETDNKGAVNHEVINDKEKNKGSKIDIIHPGINTALKIINSKTNKVFSDTSGIKLSVLNKDSTLKEMGINIDDLTEDVEGRSGDYNFGSSDRIYDDNNRDNEDNLHKRILEEVEKKHRRSQSRYTSHYNPQKLPIGHGRRGFVGVSMEKHIMDKALSKIKNKNRQLNSRMDDHTL